MNQHEIWMRRCLELARNGALTASPNPMVGAVIVHHDGTNERILGEGYHLRPGEGHAEVNALRNVRPEDRHLLPQSTIYVNLEPCSHYGRTPPCCDLIVRHGLRRCVVGCVDPFGKVSGRGIERLRAAGVETIVGVLREECIDLNRRFFCVQTLRRPFITLKWASSADGFIDRRRTLDDAGTPIGTPAQLSNRRTWMRVHQLRATHEAILVGRRTLELDRPSLNVRHWAGRSPVKYVLGSADERALDAGFQVFADIDALLDALRRDKVQSLLVEGGSATLQSFIERDLWDEAWEEHSPLVLGNGVAAPTMPAEFVAERENHYGVEYFHWKSPVLLRHYVDF